MDEKELKTLIKGCKVIDIDFNNCNRMVLETKDGKLLIIESEPKVYEGRTIGYKFGITSVNPLERLV
jgi:hypothetical protein